MYAYVLLCYLRSQIADPQNHKTHKVRIIHKRPDANHICFYTRSVALGPGPATHILMASLYSVVQYQYDCGWPCLAVRLC